MYYNGILDEMVEDDPDQYFVFIDRDGPYSWRSVAGQNIEGFNPIENLEEEYDRLMNDDVAGC